MGDDRRFVLCCLRTLVEDGLPIERDPDRKVYWYCGEEAEAKVVL